MVLILLEIQFSFFDTLPDFLAIFYDMIEVHQLSADLLVVQNIEKEAFDTVNSSNSTDTFFIASRAYVPSMIPRMTTCITI